MLLGLFGMRAVCSRLRGKYTTFPELCLSGPALSLASSGREGGGGSTGGPPGAQHLGQGRGGSPKKKNPPPKPLFLVFFFTCLCKPPAQSAQFTSSWQDRDLSVFDFSNFLPRQPILLIANETMVYFCIKKKKKNNRRKKKSIFFFFFLKLCLPFSF